VQLWKFKRLLEPGPLNGKLAFNHQMAFGIALFLHMRRSGIRQSRGKRLRPSPKPQQQKLGDGNTCSLCQGKGYVVIKKTSTTTGSLNYCEDYFSKSSDDECIATSGDIQRLIQPPLSQQFNLGNSFMLGDSTDFGNQLPVDLFDFMPAALSEIKPGCDSPSAFDQLGFDYSDFPMNNFDFNKIMEMEI